MDPFTIKNLHGITSQQLQGTKHGISNLKSFKNAEAALLGLQDWLCILNIFARKGRSG
jgi:hypothetical protein